jgi:N-formylglutamate amidohydrolase
MRPVPFWSVTGRAGPILATAIHHGHLVRADAAPWLRLGEAERLREEDPFTAWWTGVGDVQIIAHRSRFEVDLNRPRDQAIYRRPEDAWGLTVWRPEVPARVVAASLALYDAFYGRLGSVLTRLTSRFGHIVVLDLHSYNHMRDAPGIWADPAQNPDVNVGTSNMERTRWATIVDRFVEDLSRGRVRGRRLDVRENVRFQGGHMVQWIHQHFPESVCGLAVEVKKIFMDERTGIPDPRAIAEIGWALDASARGLRAELARL